LTQLRLGIRVAPRAAKRVVNDYVTWIVVGLACIGGELTLTIK
jgi:hypothetical protein